MENRDMKGLTFTLVIGALVGAAVAGTIYYLKDNEDIQNAFAKAKDKAGDILGKENWRAAGKVAGTVAQQAL
jgi:uncharacterized membrane protein